MAFTFPISRLLNDWIDERSQLNPPPRGGEVGYDPSSGEQSSREIDPMTTAASTVLSASGRLFPPRCYT